MPAVPVDGFLILRKSPNNYRDRDIGMEYEFPLIQIQDGAVERLDKRRLYGPNKFKRHSPDGEPYEIKKTGEVNSINELEYKIIYQWFQREYPESDFDMEQIRSGFDVSDWKF